MNELIERIDSLRYSGESKMLFGLRIDVSNNQLSRYYHNRASPSAAILERIANRTGCNLEWLMFGHGNPFPGSGVIGPTSKSISSYLKRKATQGEARSLGFSTTKTLDDASQIVIVQAHIDHLVGSWSPEERDRLKGLIADLHKNPELRTEVLEYADFAKTKMKKQRKKQKPESYPTEPASQHQKEKEEPK